MACLPPWTQSNCDAKTVQVLSVQVPKNPPCPNYSTSMIKLQLYDRTHTSILPPFQFGKLRTPPQILLFSIFYFLSLSLSNWQFYGAASTLPNSTLIQLMTETPLVFYINNWLKHYYYCSSWQLVWVFSPTTLTKHKEKNTKFLQ